MAYEIWERSTRNLIAGFIKWEEAHAAVRLALQTHGERYVDTWLLAFEDENEETSTLAAGKALVARASAAAA